jgi:phage terminase large subunit-like protein
MWTQARDLWIDPVRWRKGYDQTEIPAGSRIFVGVDGALFHDTTAVAWAWKQPDGRIVLRKRVWTAKTKNPHEVHVPGGRIDLTLATDFILNGLARRHRIAELVYDPAFFEGEAERIRRAGVEAAPMMQNSGHMTEAVRCFYQLVQEERLRHHPGDKVLDRHLAATAAVPTERGWRITKLGSGVIDAVTASVMAVWRADRQPSSVYGERGLVVLGVDEDDDE